MTGMVFDRDTYSSTKTVEGMRIYQFKNGCTISNTASKIYSPGNYNTIKYSKDVEYTVSIPDGMGVTSVSFMGYSNADTGDCWLANLNGTEYGEDKYRFISRKSAVNTIYTLNLDTPVTGALTFTPGGNQACWTIMFTAEPSDLRGDVNGDGVVNGTDIQAIINFIIAGEYDKKADVNNDDVVNGTDIQEVINIILTSE